MDCSEAILETPAAAYEFLFKSALAIPLSHYWVGLLLLCLVLLYNYLEFHFFQDLFTGFRGGPVFLTYNSSSEIYHGVVAKCRTLHGRYLATPWLSSPHFQTSFVNFFGRPPVFTYRRQMFHASDGGIFALDWLMHSDVAVSEAAFQNNHAMSKDDATPIVVIVPGLTSDSASPYMKHLVFYTAKQGWNVVVSNHRGLGGVSVTSDCFYNAGWTEDVREVIKYLHQEYSAAPLFVVELVKYLGEEGENVPIAGAAAVCSPWDLLIGSRFICRRLIQKLYDRALTIGLQGYAQLHETRYSRLANWDGIKKSRSIRDFDTHATCLVGNYETVDTYYRRCSSSSFIGQVSVPLLCISALDDPVCTREAIPWDECRWVRAVNEFLAALLASPFMHTQKKAESLAPHSALTQSSIDQGPYLNVADGMVAAMGNERTDSAINETAEENTDHGQTNQIASGTENHPFTSGTKSNSAKVPSKL
ncbi:UNVERIFIED_CONTAM: protein ABHD1 [Sesamum angustifolium]|uniref:Protein ABHD1 n=1 Tax=Sesamum angustifolium TaxID=2727405 RepID=A0AAW2L7S6_9LAMI